jgi:hypothetical protein
MMMAKIHLTLYPVLFIGTDSLFFITSGVGLSPLGTAATSGLWYKPQMIDESDYETIGGMKNPSMQIRSKINTNTLMEHGE